MNPAMIYTSPRQPTESAACVLLPRLVMYLESKDSLSSVHKVRHK